jgi:hypothetical protein
MPARFRKRPGLVGWAKAAEVFQFGLGGRHRPRGHGGSDAVKISTPRPPLPTLRGFSRSRVDQEADDGHIYKHKDREERCVDK